MANIFDNDGREAWAALHRAIAGTLNGGQELSGVIVQPLQIAERADWDTGNRLLNLYREQRIANQMPTWNPTYIPNSGINIPDEYMAFLDQLNSAVIANSGIPDPGKLKQLNDQRAAAQDKLQKNEYFVNKQWDRYVANNRGNPPLSRLQWETEFGYAAIRQQYQAEVSATLAAYMREINTAGGDLMEVGRALSALADPRQKMPLPQDEDDAQMAPESWQYWYRAGLADDIQQFLTTSSKLDIELNETSKITERFEDRWGGGLNVSFFGVFGVGGSASNETIKVKTEAETLNVNIHFENIQSFPVERGNWFKAGLISRFRDRMPPGFWGKSGRLNLIPTLVTLVRGVKITVKTSAEVTDYLFNKRSAGGSAGFSIGPWRVGGGGARTTIEENYSFNRVDGGFEIFDTSGRAQILAVTSVRNLDLVASPGSMLPLHALLTPAQLEIGNELVRAARRDDSNTTKAFGIEI